MADIIITIPDAAISRALDAVCAEYRYDVSKLPGETKGAFTKRMMIEDWMIRIIKKQEGFTAAAAARVAKEAEIDVDIPIT